LLSPSRVCNTAADKSQLKIFDLHHFRLLHLLQDVLNCFDFDVGKFHIDSPLVMEGSQKNNTDLPLKGLSPEILLNCGKEKHVPSKTPAQ
jgi:hypothetical protein